jgi:hypothetical protein
LQGNEGAAMTELRLRQYAMCYKSTRDDSILTEYIDATGEMHAFAQARAKIRRYNDHNELNEAFTLLSVTEDDTPAQAEFKL